MEVLKQLPKFVSFMIQQIGQIFTILGHYRSKIAEMTSFR